MIAWSVSVAAAAVVLATAVVQGGCSARTPRGDPASIATDHFFAAIVSGETSRAAGYWRFETAEDRRRYARQFGRWSASLRDARVAAARYYLLDPSDSSRETTQWTRANEAHLDVTLKISPGQETTSNVLGLRKVGGLWKITGFVRILGGSLCTRDIEPADAARLVAHADRFLGLVGKRRYRQAYMIAGLASQGLPYVQFVTRSRKVFGSFKRSIPVSVSAGDYRNHQPGTGCSPTDYPSVTVELTGARGAWRREIDFVPVMPAVNAASMRRSRSSSHDVVKRSFARAGPVPPILISRLRVSRQTFYFQRPVVLRFIHDLLDAVRQKDYERAHRLARIVPGATPERFTLLVRSAWGDFAGYEVGKPQFSEYENAVYIEVRLEGSQLAPNASRMLHLGSGIKPSLRRDTFEHIDQMVSARELLGLIKRHAYAKAYQASGLSRRESSQSGFAKQARRLFGDFDEILDVRAITWSTYENRGSDYEVRVKLRRGGRVSKRNLFFDHSCPPRLCMRTFEPPDPRRPSPFVIPCRWHGY